MNLEEAERVAELVDTLATRTALEGCLRAMRSVPGHGGMPAIQANGTANLNATVLNRAQQEPFEVDQSAETGNDD